MQIGGLSLFQALSDKMRWHQDRQGVLAENIANADTPGYVERDLKAYSFGDDMQSVASLTMRTSSPTHMSATSGGAGVYGTESSPFEITPSGNGVTLEDEMMKVSANDMDYQAVTTLYTRSMRLLKIAIGRQA
ncbi:MAG: flagellar basal body rod protein FlgB [Devosia sp.]